MHQYLEKIIKNKQHEVTALYEFINIQPDSPLARGHQNFQVLPESKISFKQSLLRNKAIISEIKRRSPSLGDLAPIENPLELAKKYIVGGAAALSVLTDKFGFNGSAQDLLNIAKFIETQNLNIPILRKDFIIDPIQIAETKILGANAILLIVTVLKEKTKSFLDYAKQLNLDVLVEVHTLEELQYAISIGSDIIGINNRNLNTFEVDINRSLELIEHVPPSVVAVSESGISSSAIAANILKAGFQAVLIGEALVKSAQPEQFIREIYGVDYAK